MLRIASKGRGEVSSHRRGDAVAADIDAIGFERAVVFLHRAEDDDLGARLYFGLFTRDEGDDRRLWRHHDFLFAVLALDQNVLTVLAFACLGHRSFRHSSPPTHTPL